MLLKDSAGKTVKVLPFILGSVVVTILNFLAICC